MERTVNTLLSPPSYTAREVKKDSALLKAFRNMKFWNLEYKGGVLQDIWGLFQEIARGGGPRLLMRSRSGSKTDGGVRAISTGVRRCSFLSLETSVWRKWSQWSYRNRCSDTHEPKSNMSIAGGATSACLVDTYKNVRTVDTYRKTRNNFLTEMSRRNPVTKCMFWTRKGFKGNM